MLWPFNKYPGTDYETFNYDWIIGKLKELKDSVAAAKSSEDAAAESATEAHGSLLAAIAQATRAGNYATHAAESASAAADSATDAYNSASAAADSATDAYNSAELYIRNNIFVTPEMYGAIGDGVTADDAAFTAALNSGKPVILLAKTYKLNNTLDIPESSVMIGSGVDKTTLLTKGLIVRGRENIISDFTITGDGTGVGILLESSSIHTDYHRNVIQNVIINNFFDGIKNNVLFWNNIFRMIRINTCSYGLHFPSTSYTSFGNLFEEVYTNSCNKAYIAEGVDAVHIACNFGLIAPEAIIFSTGARMKFISCNFECDSQIPSGSIISLSSDKYKFDGCRFRINGAAGTHAFSCSNVNGVVLENCDMSTTPDNAQTEGDFWNKSGFTATKYGAIVIGPSSHTIPRPDPYNAQMPNWRDEDAGGIVKCYGTTNLDATKTSEGAMFYDFANKKYVMYNGTAFVDV